MFSWPGCSGQKGDTRLHCSHQSLYSDYILPWKAVLTALQCCITAGRGSAVRWSGLCALQCFRVVALQTVLQGTAVPGDTKLTDWTDLLSFPVRRPAASVSTHSSILSPAGLVGHHSALHETQCGLRGGDGPPAPPPLQAGQGAGAHTGIGRVVY